MIRTKDYLTNGAQITIVSTGKSYHTWKDWHLAMSNNNPIGDPEQETFYVDVPGASGFLDYSESLSGFPVFKERTIELELGSTGAPESWQAQVAGLRNLLEGKLVRITFDDFKDFYFVGRAHITDYDRKGRLATFKLQIPKADPYGYAILSNNEPWLWDPFSFETGVIDPVKNIALSGGSKQIEVRGNEIPMPFTIKVSSGSVTVSFSGHRYTLGVGTHDSIRDLEGAQITGKTLFTFSGSGTFTMDYRRRTL